MDSAWKRLKRSGNFKRKVNKFYVNVPVKKAEEKERSCQNSGNGCKDEHEIVLNCDKTTNNEFIGEEETQNNWLVELSDSETVDGDTCFASNKPISSECEYFNNDNKFDVDGDIDIRIELKTWAITNGIKQSSLRNLLRVLNKIPCLRGKLPNDPRTLVEKKNVIIDIKHIGKAGKYWHNGLATCLRIYFRDLNESKRITINFNMDGLPLYRSSKIQFWPILANIHEQPEYDVLVIGIYCGPAKPDTPEVFLRPFTNELKDILHNGVYINGHKLSVEIRCFICDSPARSFIKGVLNFNSLIGCHKCITEGVQVKHVTVFPQIECDERTDNEFRSRSYGRYHKEYSPIQELPVDMIKQFPVSDSLHLLDLGVMKRLLNGWYTGDLGKNTKWSSAQAKIISDLLTGIKMPKEFHRAVRGLNELSHWKGTEYRTFLHYFGVVVLKDHLSDDYYYHYLLLCCAATICSSTEYEYLLDIARTLFYHFIDSYICLYELKCVTSNVHNLIHVVDEVKTLGILSTFSSYPFENKLYQIKNLLRSGNLPLEQAARRLIDLSQIIKPNEEAKSFPSLLIEAKNEDLHKLFPNCNTFFNVIKNKNFILVADNKENQWFLTYKNEIVKMITVFVQEDKVVVYGASLKRIKNFFEIPFKSSILNIFVSDSRTNSPALFSINNIKFKLVPIDYKERTVFLPLLHSNLK